MTATEQFLGILSPTRKPRMMQQVWCQLGEGDLPALLNRSGMAINGDRLCHD